MAYGKISNFGLVVLTSPGLDVATCVVANATGFGLLATNFSLLVASLATTISSYYFILINFFHFQRSMTEWMNVNCKSRGVHNVISYQFHVQSRLLGTVYTDTVSFASSSVSMTEATSTLSRINLKTQLLPRKRIKCSPCTLIVFKLFRCPDWNVASAPECWPDNLVPRVTWLLWRQRIQKIPFSLSTLTPLARVFTLIYPLWRAFSKTSVLRTPKTPF